MAFQRPPSAFRNQLGSEEFPFESGRYVLYVALACPWANGVLQVAHLKGLVRGLNDDDPKGDAPAPHVQVAVVHPTWQYTDPEADNAAFAASEVKHGMAAGVPASEPHAGWVFAQKGEPILPLALMKNAKEAIGYELPGSAQDICARKVGFYSTHEGDKILEKHGVRSAFSTTDPSRHNATTLRHLYEKCGGFMKDGVRATTPAVYDTITDRIVSNESMDIAKYFNDWGEQLQQAAGSGSYGPNLYPALLKDEIDQLIDWIYPINNGVYRCGFACSQLAYEQGATELESRMVEVEAWFDGNQGARRSFLAGEQLTIADVRLFNTLIRMDEVYVAYFKTYFGSLFAPFAGGESRFPNLLRFTARVYNTFPQVRENVVMDDIRNHYFTSHAICNMYAVVPREVGVLKALKHMEKM